MIRTHSSGRHGFQLLGAGALVLAMAVGLCGCGSAPQPTTDVSVVTPAGTPAPADSNPTATPSAPADSSTAALPPSPPPFQRIDTPFNPDFPADSQILHGWEQVYYGNLDLEPTESDSVLFFRYQALLTHLDPEMIAPNADGLRRRAVELRDAVTKSRDAAWDRWQVDLLPPPEPAPVAEAGLMQITPADKPLVQKWLDTFTGPSRERFANWLWRSGAYRDLMEEILREEGVPAELIAVVFIESGFSLTARSRARAVGPWQFISDTGRRYGLTINRHRDERRDFVLATRAAARYFKDLYGYFGDWNLAMAAYNCGEGRIFRQIARQGSSDYWSLNLPRETRDYVPEIHATLKILADPAAYGFSTESAEPLAFVEHDLPGPVRVAELASNCALSVDDLKLLNPAWLRAVTPADGQPARVRLPVGTTPAVELASMPLAPKEETVARAATHKVRRGETLSRIAKRYGISTASLARENGLSTKAALKAGRVLRLPDGVGASDAPAPRTKSGSRKSSKSSGARSSSVEYHTVQRGDTLSTIAGRYGVKVADLKSLNNLAGNSIKAGQKLRVR